MFCVHSPRCNVSDNKLVTQSFGYKGLHQMLLPFTCIAADEGPCEHKVSCSEFIVLLQCYSAFSFKKPFNEHF